MINENQKRKTKMINEKSKQKKGKPILLDFP